MSTSNKAEVIAVADAVYGAIEAVKDGFDIEDTAAAIALITAVVAAANEFKEDWDAAGLHIISRLADLFGDGRVNPVDPPTTPL